MRFINKRRWLTLLPNYIILSIFTFSALYPLAVLGFNSIKSSVEIGLNPIGPPRHILWENYPRAWTDGNFSTTTRNSAILVVGTVAGVLVLGGMAAFSIARLSLSGAKFLTFYLLVSLSLPLQLFLVPLFFFWRNLGLINNLVGLMLIYIALYTPFAIFLLRSYMVQLPADFEDAARIDGANEWQVFIKVMVPLTWPAFLTVGLVVALAVWNEFLLATVFLTEQHLFTVVTSYFNFSTRSGQDWGRTSAAAVMMIIPILVIFLSLQRRFIAGLTQGGVKG